MAYVVGVRDLLPAGCVRFQIRTVLFLAVVPDAHFSSGVCTFGGSELIDVAECVSGGGV